MSNQVLTDWELRQFLLDKVDDQARQQIESLFVVDTSFKERLLALEQELIDDYFEGSLSRGESESFVMQYAATPDQRQKLSVSKTVKAWADSESRSQSEVVFGRTRFTSIAAIVVLIGFVVLAAFWINRKLARDRRAAFEQQLAQLNSPAALKTTPNELRVVSLSPISTRGSDANSEVKADAEVLELKLLWIQPELYARYQAVIQVPGESQSYTIQDVPADKDMVRLRLPAQLLERGQVRVRLSGVGTDGFRDEYVVTVYR